MVLVKFRNTYNTGTTFRGHHYSVCKRKPLIAEFVLSQVNSQTCPENYIPITDSHECDSDMELLELQDSPHGSFLEIKSAPEQKRYPELPGCLYSFSSGSVKFNTKTSAVSVELCARRICRLMP